MQVTPLNVSIFKLQFLLLNFTVQVKLKVNSAARSLCLFVQVLYEGCIFFAINPNGFQ